MGFNMKFINKLFIVFLSASFITSTPIPASARQNVTLSPELTVAEAVNRALQRSSELKTINENIELIDLKRPMLAESAADPFNPAIVAAGAAYMQAEMQRASMSGSVSLTRQIIEMSIIRYFSTVLLVERDLELYDINLGLTKKNIDILKIRAELGHISISAYESARIDYEKALANRADKQKTADDAYRALNQVMGTTLENKYQLILDIEYKPLKERYLPGYINDSAKNSKKIKDKEYELQIAEYNERNHNGSGSAEERTIKAGQIKREIDGIKKDLEEKIRACYNDIKSQQLAYEINMMELDGMYKQLEIKKTQLELGRITQLDADVYEYQIALLEYRISALIYEHHLNVMQFENPELL